MTVRGGAVAAACALALAGGSAPAAAQAPTAIEVDRDGPPPGRTELGFDGGAPVAGWGVTAAYGLLERPITFVTDLGESDAVSRRMTLGLGGALAIGDAVVVDARLAGSRQTGARLAAFGDARALDRWVPHDVRLGARVRVAGTPSGSRAVFARGELTLPTGDGGDFAGEASWTLAWQLIGRLVLPYDVVVAAAAGVRFRGDEVRIGDRLVGDEVTGALGLVVPLRDRVSLTAELVGVLGNDVGVGRGPSPVEVRVGAFGRLCSSLTLGGRVGWGITDQIGAPAVRVGIELTYQRGYVAAPTTSSRR